MPVSRLGAIDLLAGVVAVAYFGLFKLPEWNGSFDIYSILNFNHSTIPGTSTPLNLPATGIAPIDNYVKFMVSFFCVILDTKAGNERARLQMHHCLGQMTAAWLLMVLEAHRGETNHMFIWFTHGMQFAGEWLGLGFLTPFWCMMHLIAYAPPEEVDEEAEDEAADAEEAEEETYREKIAGAQASSSSIATTAPSVAEGETVPKSDESLVVEKETAPKVFVEKAFVVKAEKIPGTLHALAWAFLLGSVIPTLFVTFFTTADGHGIWSQQTWVLLRFFHPALVFLLWKIFTTLARPIFAAGSGLVPPYWSEISTSRNYFLAVILISTIYHSSTLTLFTAKYLFPGFIKPEVVSNLDVILTFLPFPFWKTQSITPASFAEGAASFMQWDEVCTVAAIVIWAVGLYGEMYEQGKVGVADLVGVGFKGSLVAVFAGPVAAAAWTIMERDAVEIAVEQEQNKLASGQETDKTL